MRYVITLNNNIVVDETDPLPDRRKGLEIKASITPGWKLHIVEDTFPPPGQKLINNDLVEMSLDEKIQSGVYTPEQIVKIYVSEIQKRLDEFAQTKGYDGILSACTYATSTNTTFAAEGQRCVELRDSTWAAGYQILADVQSGVRPMPSLSELLNELPVLSW